MKTLFIALLPLFLMHLQAKVQDHFLYAHQGDYNLTHKAIITDLLHGKEGFVESMLTLAYFHYKNNDVPAMNRCFFNIDTYLQGQCE